MSEEKKELVFVSRHAPNNGQVALAQKMGYSSIKQINVVFNTKTLDPVRDLRKAGITEKTIAIVAPSYIINYLLNYEYTLIEFINSPVKREKTVFCCEGAYKYKLFSEQDAFGGTQLGDTRYLYINQEYIKCPISIEDQVESSLI